MTISWPAVYSLSATLLFACTTANDLEKCSSAAEDSNELDTTSFLQTGMRLDESNDELDPISFLQTAVRVIKSNSSSMGMAEGYEHAVLQPVLSSTNFDNIGNPESNAVSDFGLNRDVWSGLDEHVATSLLQVKGSEQSSHGSSFAGQSTKSAVKVLGHYNTGTHLLRELLVKNFGSALQVASPGERGSSGCTFWKHSSLSLLHEVSPGRLDACNRSGVIGIAMIRNPLSWLSSFRHVAYDLWACKDGEDWLTRPCEYPKDAPEYLGGSSFANVEEIWTDWTQDYESLHEFGFTRNLIVRYEDLVLDTERILEQIAKLAHLPLPKSVQMVDANVARLATQTPNWRTLASDKITSQTYLSDFSTKELRQACMRLGGDTMRRHGYNDCDNILSHSMLDRLADMFDQMVDMFRHRFSFSWHA